MRHRTMALALLGIALAVTWALHSAAEDDRPGEEVRRVLATAIPLARLSYRSVGGNVILPVRINGSRDLHLILDTGMSAPIVMLNHREMRQTLGLEGGHPVAIAGAGGREPRSGTIFAGAGVSFGGFDLKDQTVIVMDEGRAQSPWTQDGVIGKSIFDRYVVGIDLDRSVLSVYDPSAFDQVTDKGIPLSFGSSIPSVPATILPADGEEIPVRLTLDLGARHALSLDVGKETKVHPPARTLSTIVGRGIQG